MWSEILINYGVFILEILTVLLVIVTVGCASECVRSVPSSWPAKSGPSAMCVYRNYCSVIGRVTFHIRLVRRRLNSGSSSAGLACSNLN